MNNNNDSNKEPNKVEETAATYEIQNNMRIEFFHLFEESKENQRIQMANDSYEQRLKNLEILRQQLQLFRHEDLVNQKINSRNIETIHAHYL